MRTDCTRDNRATKLPNASHLGFDLWRAKRGNWIRFDDGNGEKFGRVIGRVHCERKTYIEVCAMLGCFDCPAIRWIDPASVIQCRSAPPANIFAFITGEWKNPADIIAAIDYGFMNK